MGGPDGVRGVVTGTSTRVAAPAAATLAALLLAGCGGGAPAGPATSTASPRPTATALPSVTGTPSVTGRPTASPAIRVHSPAFASGGRIPVRYTCRGSGVPPPLAWTGLPAGTASVALVVDDPDAPGGTYTHWVVFNLPPTASGLAGARLPAGAAQARNSSGQAGYIGPCPPSGTHHYRFTVYAERSRLALPGGAGLPAALAAIKEHAAASGRLTGLFSAG